MTMDPDATSSIVRLNIGGYEFLTTVDTLTLREPQSMLAAMFSGRYTVYKDSEKGYVFVDRDGTHFRHILNWLRDGVAPDLSNVECSELLREAEYYQLLGLLEVLNKKKDEKMDADLTRTDIIKSIQSTSTYVKLRGVNLSGLDLSGLDLSGAELSYACLKNVDFSGANFHVLNFGYISAKLCDIDDSHGAFFVGANLLSAKLQDACLTRCNFYCADLRSAHLQYTDLTYANLERANLEGANLKGAIMTVAKLKAANLQYADLRHVINLDNSDLKEANLLGAIR